MTANRFFVLLTCGAYFAIGCGKTEPNPTEKGGADATPMSSEKHDRDDDHAAHEGHSHDGWWCDEHGVPEEVCAQCDSKVAAKFQKDGDWCQEHDRPQSQCFVCDPKKAEPFIAQYKAKYGKEPPRVE